MRDRELQEQLAKQEEKLAQELEKRKVEAAREEKLIQRYREQSEELRDLESKLKAAYIKKERLTQMEEKAAREKEIKAQQLALDQKMIEHAETSTAVDQLKAAERMQKAVEAKQVMSVFPPFHPLSWFIDIYINMD